MIFWLNKIMNKDFWRIMGKEKKQKQLYETEKEMDWTYTQSTSKSIKREAIDFNMAGWVD